MSARSSHALALAVGSACALLSLCRGARAEPPQLAPVPLGAPLAVEPAPIIDVYTMGVSDDIFSHFGHAAICVTDARSPRGRCYNYGTTDFSTPVPLTWDFIRGRAKFWVSVLDAPRMLDWYRREQRTIYRQRLPLPPSEALAVARALEDSTNERVKYYRYHHFLDNCTTRIRDNLDQALGGRLSRATLGEGHGPTFRQYAEQGFAGNPLLLIAAHVILGRSSDRPTTDWEGMFLPANLREEIRVVLGVEPEVVYRSPRADEPGSTALGQLVLAGLGALSLAALALTRRFSPPLFPWVRGFSVTVLGLFGLVLWGLAAVTAFAELRENEVLLVLVPFDLALVLGTGGRRRTYLHARLIGLSAVALLGAVGVLVQPLSGALLVTTLPLLTLSVLARRG